MLRKRVKIPEDYPLENNLAIFGVNTSLLDLF